MRKAIYVTEQCYLNTPEGAVFTQNGCSRYVTSLQNCDIFLDNRMYISIKKCKASKSGCFVLFCKSEKVISRIELMKDDRII